MPQRGLLFKDFPKEILNKIFTYFDNATFIVMRFVSREYRLITLSRDIRHNLVDQGVLYNSIEFIKFGMALKHICSKKFFDVAIQNGNVEIIRLILSKINI
jgi:hypothetical protein